MGLGQSGQDHRVLVTGDRTDGVAYAVDQLLLQVYFRDDHPGLEHHQPRRYMSLEIVIARDDRAFRHRSMSGDHFIDFAGG